MNDFTKPTSYIKYLKYLMPSVLTMIFLSFYTTIDGFFVSKYTGSDALAGINIVIPIACLIFGTAVMLATGGSAMIGEHLGRGKKERADVIFTMVAKALLIYSIVFTIIGVVFLRPISVFLGASERLMEHVLPYGLIVFVGTIPMAFKLFFEYLVRTDGNPRLALKMSAVGIALNVVLDYLFVGVLDLGTFGAALGTFLSISASALIGLVYFLRYSNLKFAKGSFEVPVLKKVCVNGIGEMFTELSTGITTLIFNLIIIRKFGEDGVAAVTIIMYIYYFFIASYMGITVSSAPIISYNIGAGNPAKIKETIRYSFYTIGLNALLIMGVLLGLGDEIIGIFSGPGHVFDLTRIALNYFCPVFIFIGINVFVSGYFTAAEEGVIAAIISSLRSFVFVIIFVFLLPVFMGNNGVWAAMPVSELCTLLISLPVYFVKGRRIFRNCRVK